MYALEVIGISIFIIALGFFITTKEEIKEIIINMIIQLKI